MNSQTLHFPHLDQSVEYRFPGLVACKVIVGDEEIVHVLREIGAHELLDVVGATRPRFASLDVDDRAEAAQKGTAPAGVKAGSSASGTANDVYR